MLPEMLLVLPDNAGGSSITGHHVAPFVFIHGSRRAHIAAMGAKRKAATEAPTCETRPRGPTPHGYVWADGEWRDDAGEVRQAAEDRRNYHREYTRNRVRGDRRFEGRGKRDENASQSRKAQVEENQKRKPNDSLPKVSKKKQKVAAATAAVNATAKSKSRPKPKPKSKPSATSERRKTTKATTAKLKISWHLRSCTHSRNGWMFCLDNGVCDSRRHDGILHYMSLIATSVLHSACTRDYHTSHKSGSFPRERARAWRERPGRRPPS